MTDEERGGLQVAIVSSALDDVALFFTQAAIRGHQAQSFESHEKAWARHGEVAFDVFVVDIGRGGLSLVARLSAERSSPHIIVIGSDYDVDLEGAVQAGADDYLACPLDPGLVRARLVVAERLFDERLSRHESNIEHLERDAGLEALIENTNDAIFSVDADYRLTVANSVTRNLVYLAFGVEIHPGVDVLSVVPEDLRAAVEDRLSRALRGERFFTEWRYESESTILDVEAHFNPICTTVGTVTGVSVFARNVTEKKEAEARLTRSQRDLRELIETMPDGIIIDYDGAVAYANPTLATMLSYDNPLELVGQPVLDLVARTDRGAIERLWEEWLATGTSPVDREIQLVAKDGSKVDAEVKLGASVEFEGQSARVMTIRDVSERKRMQSKLMLTERMASAGTLAAGVAHEINNPLGYVAANLDYLSERMDKLSSHLPPDERDDVRDAIVEARDGAERVRAIVADLHQFTRVDREAMGSVDLDKVIHSAMRITQNQLRHRARVRTDFHDVGRVHGNEGRLAQVFVNLLVNAGQAMQGDPEDNEVLIRTRQEDATVFVEVVDTGCGMSPDVQRRVFDPFFTTKEIGVGTGLGLSICHSIVVGFGGEIQIESERGRGTTMRVVLPVARESEPAWTPRTSVQPEPPRVARGRILVVDDERMVGRSLRRALSRHEVVVAESGSEALQQIEQKQFDVILCDLMMPGMSGMDLYERLQESHPELAERMVFMTGGAFTERARRFLEETPNPCLEKPFEMDRVKRVIGKQMTIGASDDHRTTIAPPPIDES